MTPATLQLALAYQLMGAQTNCILVHQRAEADKPQEAAELHRVQAMLAAGWSATSSVADPEVVLRSRSRAQRVDSLDFDGGAEFNSQSSSVMWRSSHSPAADSSRSVRTSGIKFGIGSAISSATKQTTLADVAQTVADHFSSGWSLADLVHRCRALRVDMRVTLCLVEVMTAGIAKAQAWLLLAHWVNTREGAADPGISAALQAPLATIDPQTISVAESIFEGQLGGYDLVDWESFRARRLATALGQETAATGGQMDEVEIPDFLKKAFI